MIGVLANQHGMGNGHCTTLSLSRFLRKLRKTCGNGTHLLNWNLIVLHWRHHLWGAIAHFPDTAPCFSPTSRVTGRHDRSPTEVSVGACTTGLHIAQNASEDQVRESRQHPFPARLLDMEIWWRYGGDMDDDFVTSGWIWMVRCVLGTWRKTILESDDHLHSIPLTNQ